MSGWRRPEASDQGARCDGVGHYVMVGVCVRCGIEIARDSTVGGGAGPLGSGHSPRASDAVADRGGSVEDPSTHLIHGPASSTDQLDGGQV